MAAGERPELLQAPNELSIVRSGLEETMAVAYGEIREALQQHSDLRDLRTAAYFTALSKVAQVYLERGIFP